MPRLFRCVLLSLVCAIGNPQSAIANSQVSVAAATNLVYALDALQAEFRRHAPDVTLQVTTSASGSLFAQLRHGAPFDVFLSADTDYPQRAVADGLAPAASLRTFARGRLVLWTTHAHLDLADPIAALRSPSVKKIALAQPKTAPYGRAAQAVLAHLDLTAAVAPKLVYGESITQAAQFVETGSADLGFVALSLIKSPRLAHRGRWHELPAALHAAVPLDHAAVLTLRGAKNPAAPRFLDFLFTAAAQKILRDFGYDVPSPAP